MLRIFLGGHYIPLRALHYAFRKLSSSIPRRYFCLLVGYVQCYFHPYTALALHFFHWLVRFVLLRYPLV
ncbi:hypothetical protein BDZ91DRAFT_740096 [Kalaharituber pfeilii]|nr:hypothetical protein BDZ91DRAFT_740096 [Kalaharituber pfeilii]